MNTSRKAATPSLRRELFWAQRFWPAQISQVLRDQFKKLAVTHGFSILSGDLMIIGGKWYVTHSGLLGLSARRRSQGIRTELVREFCDKSAQRWAFRATVFTGKYCKGFVGYGDADPSNVSPLLRGAEMRIAETRAVNRALRKAYGIGICSVEEIGASATQSGAESQPKKHSQPAATQNGNGGSNFGGPKVRDRLCQLIRQHELDANLVKSYATDFCGVKALREATREQVENFVTHLADWAEKDRNALLCQLNSYLSCKDGAA
jgi:hypothetical protein